MHMPDCETVTRYQNRHQTCPVALCLAALVDSYRQMHTPNLLASNLLVYHATGWLILQLASQATGYWI